jgi:hypothetical protein
VRQISVKNQKVPSRFSDLGLGVSKGLPLASALSSQVPFGNNAVYIEIAFHKIFKYIYASKFKFRQQAT